jgi:hypothetical protein
MVYDFMGNNMFYRVSPLEKDIVLFLMIAYRIIKHFLTRRDSINPFVGSGTTMKAART